MITTLYNNLKFYYQQLFKTVLIIIPYISISSYFILNDTSIINIDGVKIFNIIDYLLFFYFLLTLMYTRNTLIEALTNLKDDLTPKGTITISASKIQLGPFGYTCNITTNLLDPDTIKCELSDIHTHLKIVVEDLLQHKNSYVVNINNITQDIANINNKFVETTTCFNRTINSSHNSIVSLLLGNKKYEFLLITLLLGRASVGYTLLDFVN